MSVPATEREVRELMRQFDIAFGQRPKNGIAAEISGRYERGGKTISLAIGQQCVLHPCPLDEAQAERAVAQLHNVGALPADTSFQKLVAHLLVKSSQLYEQENIDAFTFENVHLHPTGYEIGAARMWRTKPLHLTPRARSTRPDFHQSFPHLPQGKR